MRLRMHQRRERIEIRALELRELAVLHEQLRERMALLGELAQHRGVRRWTRGRALDDRQLQLLEENRAQLGVGVDVELLAGLTVDLLLHALAFLSEAFLERREPLAVDRDPRPFHFGEHADEGHLDLLEERCEPVGLELRLEQRAEPERHVGILARVVTRRFDRTFVERNGALPLPAELLEGRHRVIEKLERQHVEPVRAAARIEHVARDHRVEVEAAKLDPHPPQREQIELRVLRRFPDAGILEQLAERRHLRRVERRKILHGTRAFSQQSRGNARGLGGSRLLPGPRALRRW